jgi:hypothetical protein
LLGWLPACCCCPKWRSFFFIGGAGFAAPLQQKIHPHVD